MAFNAANPELGRADSDAHQTGVHRDSNEVERVLSASSDSTSSSEAATSRRPLSMSRIPTSNELERHPTELSRIHTALSQHESTVGRSHSRGVKRRDSKPLPKFGAGKPFPPDLPNREAYVVEFEGPDDPYHAQNWPLKKK